MAALPPNSAGYRGRGPPSHGVLAERYSVHPSDVLGYCFSTTTMSTRRLYARPSGVSFDCTGRVLPKVAPDSLSEGIP